jgi:integrase
MSAFCVGLDCAVPIEWPRRAWRTGLRISEALALEETDLDQEHQSVTVKRGKGGKRRIVMMDAW